MAKQNIWKILESVAQSQAASAQLKEEHDREMKELRDIVKETAQQIKQVNQQLGELGNKWGDFTEGMAWPLMNKILRDQFGMNSVNPHTVHLNGRTLEIDFFGYDSTGSRDEVYVVEVKNRLDKDGIDQILRIIEDLPKFEAFTRGRKIYGVIAAVDIPKEMYNVAINKGLYVARVSDDTFELAVPRGFKPKAFGADKQNGHVGGRKKKSRKD
jgi:hypothetical protein